MVTVEVVTVEVVTVEAVTVEAVTVQAVTVQAVTVEAVTVKAVTVEAVTVEAVAVEAVTVGAVTLAAAIGRGGEVVTSAKVGGSWPVFIHPARGGRCSGRERISLQLRRSTFCRAATMNHNGRHNA